jgi:hypothetical protein
MFQTEGTCWHTGYRPTIPRVQDLPAIRRMKNRVMSKDEIEERENDERGRPRTK